MSVALPSGGARRFAAAVLLAWAAAAGCAEAPAGPTGAFEDPIDWSYACEGVGRTTPPMNDERASNFQATRMCPDLSIGGQTVQAHLLGVVLDANPAGVHVVQMNPASPGSVRVLDAEAFVPGFTRIPVGEAPIRLLRSADFGAFWVVSAGSRDVTRLVLQGVQATGSLAYETSSFPLPGAPGDALVAGNALVVSAAHAAELWLFDLAAGGEVPPMTSVALEGVARSLAEHDGKLLVTWNERPVVTVLDLDGTVVAEAGIRPECSDTLDDDGDGLVDATDPDCRSEGDPSESGAAVRPDELEPPASFTGEVDLCHDLLDNDGDGATDLEDPSCDPDRPGGASEIVPECADGLDADGDDLIDLADESCFGAYDLTEGQLAPFGPYGAVSVDARDGGAGLWVVTVDPERQRVQVFDAAGGALSRVAVPGRSIEVPPRFSMSYSRASGLLEDAEEGVVEALEVNVATPIRVAGLPGPAFQDETDLRLPAPVVPRPLATRLRGEEWSRMIPLDEDLGRPVVPLGLSSGSGVFVPPTCDPFLALPEKGADGTLFPGVCAEPLWDDRTWSVFLPRLDGRIQQVEVVRRGTPVLRFAQTVQDPGARGTDVSRPALSRRGTSIAVGASLRPGFPFLGPLTTEEIAPAEKGESPALFRRFGVWPAEDPELVPTETWRVTYEGAIPGTSTVLGRLLAADGFYDPKARFCELGVAPGDWLVLEAHPGTIDPALHHSLPVETEDGEPCATEPIERAEVEVRIAEVGQTTLVLDPASARLRPVEPVLDLDAIEAAGLSKKACQDALEALLDTLTRDENLAAAPAGAFTPASFPPRLAYSVRAAGVYAVAGTRSGFLHRQVWTPDDALEPLGGTCVEDESLDPRLTGRVPEVPLTPGAYATCPPGIDQIGFEAVDSLLPAGAARLETYSFALDVFPGCEVAEDGTVALVPTQRDTRWTFGVTGPDVPDSTAGGGSLLSARIGLFDARRQLVQLDAATGRVHLLQVRPGRVDLLQTHE